MRIRVERNGYAYVALGSSKRKEQRHYTIHRLIALTFLGPRPDGMEICHLNHDQTDNRSENLAYVTHDENEKQKVAAGRQVRGERVPKSKLTEVQVKYIRIEYMGGGSVATLAEVYGVSKETIRQICKRKTWKHLDVVPIERQA